MAAVINISYDGPDMAPNTIIGLWVHPSKTAKLWTCGLADREQPLSSFFPLGFLTPPIVCLYLMLCFPLSYFYLFFLNTLFPSLPTFCFRGWKGVNLRLTTQRHLLFVHIWLLIISCATYPFSSLSSLITSLNSYHHFL